jgi:outer membrane cobalamin receptor
MTAVTARAQNAPLTDDELLAQSEAEVIQVWAERPSKPFDRDTSLRLTGAELAKRGATDLGSALALLPDVSVREVGRGGFNVDIRGARKGSVRVLIDGVSVSDPYYGTFDVSTIPITDIVQIRVATTALSPIDGPGGPGGVIEVHTRDAIGTQVVNARIGADSLPSTSFAGSARAHITKRWAVRLSSSGVLGAREFSVPTATPDSTAKLTEGRRAANIALRVEYRDGRVADGSDDSRLTAHTKRRLVIDIVADDRRYLSPPNETRIGTLLLIDRETTWRAGVGIDEQRGRWQLAGRGWLHSLARTSRNFRDAEFTDQAQLEDLRALRVGSQALVTRPIGTQRRVAASLVVDHERAESVDAQGASNHGHATIVELAGNVQTQTPTTKVDGAVGVAVPFGVGASAWLEAKVVGRWQPRWWLELVATAARKGRTPTLRERFDRSIGNPTLAPELANAAEVRAIASSGRLKFEAAPYLRRSTGTTRIGAMSGVLENIGTLTVYGVDLTASVKIDNRFGTYRIGGAYTPVRAIAATSGDGDALDRLPRHRGEAWIEAEPWQSLSSRLRIRAYGQSIDQGQTVPGATIVDGNAAYTWAQGRQVSLRVDDVLNARPPLRTGYFAPGRTAMLMLLWQW